MGKKRTEITESMYISPIWLSDFFFVGGVDSRKLSGTFRNCNKFDNWRDEGCHLLVAQALTGNECNSSWVDTGVCSTEPRHQHPKQWQSASSADFWVTLNQGGVLTCWMAEFQPGWTLRNLRSGQAEIPWSSARRNAKFCIWGGINPARVHAGELKKTQRL